MGNGGPIRWLSDPQLQTLLSRCKSITVTIPNSPASVLRSPTELVGFTPGNPALPLVDSPRVLALNELMVPGAMVPLVTALLLATRWMMSSGAMAWPIPHRVG